MQDTFGADMTSPKKKEIAAPKPAIPKLKLGQK